MIELVFARDSLEKMEFSMPRIKKHNANESEARTMAVEELLNSGLVGIWKDRKDIRDTVEFARELREKAWTHKNMILKKHHRSKH